MEKEEILRCIKCAIESRVGFLEDGINNKTSAKDLLIDLGTLNGYINLAHILGVISNDELIMFQDIFSKFYDVIYDLV